MKNFLEKTILDMQSVFGDLFYSEATARQKGLLQMIDPRVKMLSILGLSIVANLVRTIPALVMIIGYLLLLAVCSKVPMVPYLRRIVAITLIFTGVVVLPSIFNIVKPGEPLWRISKYLYITKPGFHGASLLLLRSFASTSLIYLLIATTKWAEILKSLRVLKISAPFVATLEMTNRYIFLGLELASNLFLARKSRGLGKYSGKEGRRFIAGTAGNLLVRTTVFGDEIYQAMLSRGYTGEVKSYSRFRMRIVDYFWLILNIALIVVFKTRFKLS